MLALVEMRKADDLPRWVKIVMVVLKNWKETVGSLFILVTLYMWYFNMITEQKAVFGLILLVAGGFINNTIDFIGFFKYLGNYKNKGDDNQAS
jgi:hypothetical protein